MSVSSGAEYLSRLRDGREVWLGGERVEDVTAHADLRRGAATLARLLDRQQAAETRELLMAAAYYRLYDKEPYMERVRELLARSE